MINFKTLYTYWATPLLFMATLITFMIFVFSPFIGFNNFLIWIQLPIFMYHQYEEHADNKLQKFSNEFLLFLRPKGQFFTDKKFFWAGVTLTWGLLPILAAFAMYYNAVAMWLFAIVLCNNVLVHIAIYLKVKKYNPGLYVAVFVQLPVGLLSVFCFLFTSSATIIDFFWGMLIALVLQMILFFSVRFSKS